MIRRLFARDDEEPPDEELESDRIADAWYEAKYSGADAATLAALDAQHAAALAAERAEREAARPWWKRW